MDDPLEWQPRGKIMMIFLEHGMQVALGVGPPKVPSWKLGMGHDGSKLSILPQGGSSKLNHMKITWTFHQIFLFPHGPLADLSLMLVHWNPKDNVFVHVKVAVQQSVMPESTELVPWLWRSLKSGGYMDIWISLIFGYLDIMNQSIRTFVFSNCGDLYNQEIPRDFGRFSNSTIQFDMWAGCRTIIWKDWNRQKSSQNDSSSNSKWSFRFCSQLCVVWYPIDVGRFTHYPMVQGDVQAGQRARADWVLCGGRGTFRPLGCGDVFFFASVGNMILSIATFQKKEK